MKRNLFFLVQLMMYWLGLFWIIKALFIVFNLNLSNLSVSVLTGIFSNGFGLDLSSASYFTFATLIPVILIGLLKISKTGSWVTGTVLILSIFYLAIGIIDVRLYHYWGFKLNYSLFRFLRHPSEATASIQRSDYIVLIVCLTAAGTYIFFCARLLKRKWKEVLNPRKNAVVLLLMSSVLIVPLRGGLGVMPIGLSTAYFSDEISVNHAAVNPFWNLTYSFLNRDRTEIHITDSSVEINEAFRSEIYQDTTTYFRPQLPPKTNVLIIALESFSARFTEPIGGLPEVTPQLNRCAEEGILFSRCYASGDRSDKGLTSILTGFPALPKAGLTRFPDKIQQWPNLYRNFEEAGYQTSFSYGGNPDFANISALFKTTASCKIFNESHFEKVSGMKKGKWGVHDAYVFSQSLEDLDELKEPFFSCIYTLSSHEPFDVPATSRTFSGRKGKTYTSVFYSDSCLGVFLDAFRQTDLWNRTLVVITADHGIRQPDGLEVIDPRKYHVPLILTGGVIKEHNRIEQVVSHTDLPYTIQEIVLNMKDSMMKFSKSLFSAKSFAYYFYEIGCGKIDDSTTLVYDFPAQKVFLRQPKELIKEQDKVRDILLYSQSVGDEFNALK